MSWKVWSLLFSIISLVECRDEREQRISDVEYISQAVRAKAEECLAAVDDGQSPQLPLALQPEGQMATPPVRGGGGGVGVSWPVQLGGMHTVLPVRKSP